MREYHEKKVMTKNRNFWIGAEIARSGNSSKKYGISNFTTEEVSDLNRMFVECKSLKNLHFSNFNTEKYF